MTRDRIMLIDRRTAVLGIAASAAANITPARAAKSFRIVVTEAETPLVPNSVVQLAKPLGYYDRERVGVEIMHVAQTPLAIAALISGAADMANVGVDALLHFATRSDVRIKAVMSPNKTLPFLIAARRNIGSVADLKGATFGIARIGSLDHSLTMALLRAKGVDPSSMHLLALGEPRWRAQALATGRLDATTISIGSWASLPARDDLHVLVTASEFHATLPFVSKLNAVRDATIAERRPEIDAVVRALIAAGRDFHADERRWTSAMRTARPDVPAEVLDRLAPEFRDGWCVNGGLNRQELVATQDWIFREPDFAGLKPPPLHDWVDFSFVDQALADLKRIDGLDAPVR